jgi:hypothetical protein
MLLVYVKNWCSGRNFHNGGHSQHSLDVESFSLLEIKQDTKGPNKEVRQSLAVGDVDGSRTSHAQQDGAGGRSRVLQTQASQKLLRQSIRQSITPNSPSATLYVPKSVKSKMSSSR